MKFDPIRILQTLARHKVQFVLIGGQAAIAHGSPSVTFDLDICYQRSPQNLERLASALKERSARLRGVEDDVPFILDAKTIEIGDHFTFETDAGSFDCLGTPSGVNGYEDLASAASPVDFDGMSVLVASLDDLIRMKQAAGRPKDLIEVEVLGALRDELEAADE